MNTIIQEKNSQVFTDDQTTQIDKQQVMNDIQIQQMDNAIFHDPNVEKQGGLDMRILVLGAMNFLINAATSLIVPLFPNQLDL